MTRGTGQTKFIKVLDKAEVKSCHFSFRQTKYLKKCLKIDPVLKKHSFTPVHSLTLDFVVKKFRF